MSRREILLKAIEVIEERGWCQAPTAEDTSVCIQYAISWAMEKKPFCLASSVAQPVLGCVTSPFPWEWNDAYGRTKEEVIEVLRFLADTDMSWDDAMDIWEANEKLPAFPVETRQLAAVAA